MWGMWIKFAKFSPKEDVENGDSDWISHFGDYWKRKNFVEMIGNIQIGFGWERGKRVEN